jgi:hypothetical protein
VRAGTSVGVGAGFELLDVSAERSARRVDVTCLTRVTVFVTVVVSTGGVVAASAEDWASGWAESATAPSPPRLVNVAATAITVRLVMTGMVIPRR